jgi:hypothetical protein
VENFGRVRIPLQLQKMLQQTLPAAPTKPPGNRATFSPIDLCGF